MARRRRPKTLAKPGADFSVGDRVRFVYPNAPTGIGTVVEHDLDPKSKPYKVRLDTPWRAFREGRWSEFSVVYAEADQIELIGDE